MVDAKLLERLRGSLNNGELEVSTEEIIELIPFLAVLNKTYKTEVFKENSAEISNSSLLTRWASDLIKQILNKDPEATKVLSRLIFEPIGKLSGKKEKYPGN